MDYVERVAREKREEANREFAKSQKEADSWGSYSKDNSNLSSVNGKDYEAKVRDAQKKMSRIIKWQLNQNQNRGRKYGDGREI